MTELNHYPDLAGKVAVVTGGSRGIGAATARALAANGAAVAVIGRDDEALAGIAASIQERGKRALAVRADCTVQPELERAAQTIAEQLGPADIVAAFAGGNGMPVATAEETAAHWREVIESDLTSTFQTVSAFLPAMIERQGGSIVTMSSAAARQAARSSAAYAAAKAGMLGLTRVTAAEAARKGVRVNAICPGPVTETVMSQELGATLAKKIGVSSEEQLAGFLQSILQGRGQTADEIAHAALFLCSNASSAMTGQSINVDGGAAFF